MHKLPASDAENSSALGSGLGSGLGLGLGIDAGGSQTRWALATTSGAILAEGQVAGLSALQIGTANACEGVHACLAQLAGAVLALGKPGRVRAGLTGFGGEGAQIAEWLAHALQLDAGAITLCSDIEIAYLDSFEPGQGYLVYAGTGSIAAWIDSAGQLHRAGGLGVLLDDGGGGYWIAREALRHIWRAEDECPGAWRGSALAHAVFEQLGGSDWAVTRRFMYGQERGAIGQLALAVAAAAERDPIAYNILYRAGGELARLALALTARHGPRPVVLSGRASELHPVIFEAMRAALPKDISLQQRTGQAHHAAARIAAKAASAGLPSDQ